MPVSPPTPIGEDGLFRGRLVIRGKYDFAADGGAASTIAITSGLPIPSGAVIVGGYIDVTTSLTSSGAATIAVQVNAANDIMTAVAVATWVAGRYNILPALSAGTMSTSTSVKTTAARNISIVIASADLTAGVANVVLFAVPPLA